MLGGGLVAGGAGALAGFGALGGAGMLASASTGTAISSLSGAAATNATLAWFGGGSISAGGFGMAGGMAVLGGIVAGPVLAVGGAFIAAKAKEAKYNAYANYDKAEVEAEQLNIAKIIVDEIGLRTTEFKLVLEPLNHSLKNYTMMIEYIVNKNDDYSTYSAD